MSLCDGFKARVNTYTGFWIARSKTPSKARALSLLKAKMVRFGAAQEGIVCEGRECRDDPHATCYGAAEITAGAVRYLPTTVVTGGKGKKATAATGILCLYQGEVTITCHCTQPSKPGKPQGTIAPRRMT